MKNIDQRLAFNIKEIIEENAIPYTKAAIIGDISLLELKNILLGHSEAKRETLIKVFLQLDNCYPVTW
ncbi:MAG: hypothetical protein ISR65_12005 [Bacteriovoracaceae bacterium]|nr:hypothetical protein [Bacteriovoracaceae bacterium]